MAFGSVCRTFGLRGFDALVVPFGSLSSPISTDAQLSSVI